jgi:hypothetical protein
MKRFRTIVFLLVLSAACLAPIHAYASSNNPRSQARADRKAQKKQQKAMKKYMKAQRKAQKKMIKKDRKNTHLPSHY